MELVFDISTCQSYIRDSLLSARQEQTLTPQLQEFTTHLSQALFAGTNPQHGIYNTRVAREGNDGELYYTDYNHHTRRTNYIYVKNPVKKTYFDYRSMFFDRFRHTEDNEEYSEWISATFRQQMSINDLYFATLLALVGAFADSDAFTTLIVEGTDKERSLMADMLIAINLATVASARYSDDREPQYLSALQILWRNARLDHDIHFTTEQFAAWQEQSPVYGLNDFWGSFSFAPIDQATLDPHELLSILEHHQLIQQNKDNSWTAAHLLFLQDACGELL